MQYLCSRFYSLWIFYVTIFILRHPVPVNGSGEPLFLTPYILAGQLAEARNLSLVGPISGMDANSVSYSGYLTVNSKYNSNLFFWFCQAQANSDAAPLLLWLQGGPGSSSMYGMFVEIGPYNLISDNDTVQPIPNYYAWNTYYNVLFVDNPVGTGFSFTDYDEGYTRNQDDVSRDLYIGLGQFFALFPEYVTNDFYITGESYAGKYIPALGHKIHLANPDAEVAINLKGIAIGNGFVDPTSQLEYGDYLFNVGMIDDNQRTIFNKKQAEIRKDIAMNRMSDAYNGISQLLLSDDDDEPSYFINITGSKSYYNILETKKPDTFYEKYVQQPEIRYAIHVGNRTFYNGSTALKFLINDVMNSTKPLLESLINNDYKVMLYSGQLDIIVAYPLTMSLLEAMTWKTKPDYNAASRVIWKIDPQDDDVAGYARYSHNFVEILVRNAGHMVPLNQPRAALDLICRFIMDASWET